MSQLHVTRVKREFREIITSEEVSLTSESQNGGDGGGGGGCPSLIGTLSFLLLTFASPLSVGSTTYLLAKVNIKLWRSYANCMFSS